MTNKYATTTVCYGRILYQKLAQHLDFNRNTYAVSMHIHCMKRDLHLLLLVLTSRWCNRELIKIKSNREKEALTSTSHLL